MQTAFWVVLTVVTFFSLTLWYGAATTPHVLHTLLQSLLGFLITLPMQWIYRKTWGWKPNYLFALIALVVVTFSLFWSVLRLATFIWLTDEGFEVWSDFGGWYFSGFFIFLCWTALYYSLHYYRMATEERDRRLKLVEKSRAEKVRRLQAEKLAADARMRMLRYQLNPHFLFNTLNAISALVVTEDLVRARQMVDKLSQFLRYALKEDKKGWVNLSSEIEALELYLSIEKVRFEERLQVDYTIEDNVLQLEVPSLILQPLVENAIKHAINSMEQGGKITIFAGLDDNQLLMSVADNGPGIVELQSGEFGSESLSFSGVGLRNIVERLESLYGDSAKVSVLNERNRGLQVQIRLPLDHS